MTQINIDVMDIIVSKVAEGMKISEALKFVYWKRNVSIPYNDKEFDTSVMSLGMSTRTTNALMRAKLKKVSDVISFCGEHKITEVSYLGKNSGVELFETILNYCWNNMNDNERLLFLIDTIERNENYLRENICKN